MTKRERNYHKRLKSMAPLDRLYYHRFRRIQRRIRAAKTVPAAVEGALQLIRAAITYKRIKARHAKKAIGGIPHVSQTGPEVILVGADTTRAVSALEGIRTAIRIAPPPAQNRTFVSADIYEAIQKRPTIVEEAIKETARRIVDGTDPNT